MRKARATEVLSVSRVVALTAALSIVTLWTTALPSHATFINVLSQEYSIGGEVAIGYGELERSEFRYSYDYASSNPVSHMVGLITPPTYARGGAFMNSYATSMLGPDSVELEIHRNFFDAGDAQIYRGYASASLTFSALASSLLLTPDIQAGMGARATIFNLTDGTLLYSGAVGASSVMLFFDLGDVYSMKIESTSAYTSSSTASIGLQSVPEPSSSLLLLSSGIVLFFSRIMKHRLTSDYPES